MQCPICHNTSTCTILQKKLEIRTEQAVDRDSCIGYICVFLRFNFIANVASINVSVLNLFDFLSLLFDEVTDDHFISFVTCLSRAVINDRG